MLPDPNEAIEISVLFLESLYHFLTYGQEGHWQSQIAGLLQVIHLASHSQALALRETSIASNLLEDNRTGQKQSRRFFISFSSKWEVNEEKQCVGLHISEGLVGNVRLKGNLACSKHGIVELRAYNEVQQGELQTYYSSTYTWEQPHVYAEDPQMESKLTEKRCPVPGPEATGTNWNTGGFLSRSGNSFSLWWWLSSGVSCPEKLSSLPPWWYSKPVWTWFWATRSRWCCFNRGLVKMTSRGPFQPHPFCDNHPENHVLLVRMYTQNHTHTWVWA